MASVITGSDRWYVVGGGLVTTVRAGLSRTVARYGQVPGEIAWDDCHCDGLLAVTVPRVYRSEVFPAESEAPVGVRCQAPYEVAEFTVSVLRCVAGPDGQNLSPTAAQLDSAARVLMVDIAETIDALMPYLCALKDADSISDFMVSPAQSAGPEGACVGFTLRVLISLEV
jgi:hypothetical protein